MSKYIKQKQTKAKQPKPKLKILVQMNGEDFYLNEYDLAQMISNLNVQMSQMAQTVQGITDAMKAATEGTVTNSSQPIQQELKLPKLQTSKLDEGTKFYSNSSEGVKLES